MSTLSPTHYFRSTIGHFGGRCQNLRLALRTIGQFGLLVFSIQANGVSFGVYDARTQALAGTAVALGTVAEGHFYNPAITAMHDGDEDDTRDGKYIFPISATLSDGATTAAKAISDDLELELTNAVTNFNNSPGAEAAVVGEAAARELQDAMRDLQDEDIFFDAYSGFSVSEPGDGQGGAVFVGARLVGAGITDIADADISLLDSYIEALQYIGSNQMQGSPHPELFDPVDGTLINPTQTIVSSAEAQALVISEIGVSAAKRWDWWGQQFSFGVAPKILVVTTFDDSWQVSNGNFESNGNDDTVLTFNTDLGMLVQLNEVFRVGLTVKDALPKSYETLLGNTFDLKPRARLGLAYVGKRFQIGLDADIVPNKITTTTFERQDVSLGAEYSIFNGWALRAGYRTDLEDSVGQTSSIGFSCKLSKRLMIEMAYVTGDNQTGGTLQLSLVQ